MHTVFVRNRRAILSIAIAAVVGDIAWCGRPGAIPRSLIFPPVVLTQRTRATACSVALAYYSGASWPLIPGARVFFGPTLPSPSRCYFGLPQPPGERAAVLICYEQLLVWPVVAAALDRPTLLVGIANDYWAVGTRIPAVQKGELRAWAQLQEIAAFGRRWAQLRASRIGFHPASAR